MMRLSGTLIPAVRMGAGSLAMAFERDARSESWRVVMYPMFGLGAWVGMMWFAEIGSSDWDSRAWAEVLS